MIELNNRKKDHEQVSYYFTSGMKKLGEMIVTGLCTALVLAALSLFKSDQDQKFKLINESQDRIEKKTSQFVTEERFNQLLEIKLKQFKVNREGRLIVVP